MSHSPEGGLLLVHAHPDDEVFSTGGTIAQALADGRRVDLVVCTGGEEGEIHDSDLDPAEAQPRLREIREAELHCALAALSAASATEELLHLHQLGHRDSGMIGTPGNDRPDAFWQADLGVAAEPVVRLIREARPAVAIHYDENGGYGHPDHIQAHRIAVAAVSAAAELGRYPDSGPVHRVSRRYQTAFGSGRWLDLMRAMRERGMSLPWGYDEVVDGEEPAEERPGTVEPAVTTVIDVAPWLAAKRAAMECHRTQRQDFGWAIELPDDLAIMAFGSERFVLVERDGAEPPAGLSETSLFPRVFESGLARAANRGRRALQLAAHGDLPVNCPACGTANEPGRKFCGECGTALSAACPACGTLNAPGTKFCGECGTALTDATAPVGAAAGSEPTTTTVTAERRVVSILFADLVGSTTLAEDRDPEETRNLLNRYFETTSEVIGRYGGTVEKFIGDAVMAVWGVPTAHEDDAERAVRAALEMVDAVSAISDAGTPLQVRAAVLTGEAAATIGATGQGIVAGDLVNTASRLQGMAPPGTVLVGDATRRATAEAIAYEEIGEQQLKGKATPVPAWRAVSVLGMRGGARRRASLEAPFVGRDEELRLVKDLFHATIREHKPRLVTVIGQAGIGKSRLGWEFEKYIDGVALDAYWHAGRSPSYGEGISFWALAEMVRERAGIAETDPPETSRAKLAACLAEWLPDAEERSWVEPRLAGLLGLEEMPAGQREELFAAWRTFFERIADRDPVILVFKDLHWADAGLLEFIEHLLGWAKNHPIYVLAMTRPDLLERHPGWGSAVRNATTISLEPLGDEPMTELLRGLAPGLPNDAVAAILARAEGVPLYAVETVRMLIDRGQLVAEGDSFILAGPLTNLDVPDTLHALVAARIDANEPEDRALLADGAILGQSFTPSALAGLTERSEESLQSGLDRLVRRELLIRDDDPRSPERGQYRFVQAVVREVAYDTLSKADRRAKHLAAARFYEGIGDEELAGVLATHYVEALKATPAGPEAEALSAQARIALRAAADRATALNAWSVVVHHLTAALEIATDDAERTALLLGLARAGMRLIDPSTPDRALEAAVLADGIGDRGSANRARALASQYYNHVSRSVQALAVVEPVIGSLSEDEPGAGALFAEAARAYMLVDRWVDSETYSERALRAAGPRRETDVVASVLSTRGAALPALGRPDEAVALQRGAVALADESGHIDQALRARNNLLATAFEDMPIGAAMPVLDESVDIARRYGMAGHLALSLHARSDARFSAGLWAGARQDMDEAEELPLAEARRAVSHGQFAILEAAIGDDGAARGRLAEAERLVGFVESAPQVGAVALSKAITHMLLGEPDAALADLEGISGGGGNVILMEWQLAAGAAVADARAVARARVLAKALAAAELPRVVGHHLAAVDASLTGRWDEAASAFERAIAGYRNMGYDFDAEMTALAFDGYLGARFPNARRAGAAAEAWFAERGSSTPVERYRAAFRGTPAPSAGVPPSKARASTSEVEAR